MDFGLKADVTDADGVSRSVAAVEGRFGRICVTKAGGPPSKTFLEISPEEWRAAADLNLTKLERHEEPR